MSDINNENKNTIYGAFGLHWPPIDNDYDKIFNEGILRKQYWINILVYVKNDTGLLIFDPLNISKEYSKSYNIKNDNNINKSYKVILIEYMK